MIRVPQQTLNKWEREAWAVYRLLHRASSRLPSDDPFFDEVTDGLNAAGRIYVRALLSASTTAQLLAWLNKTYVNDRGYVWDEDKRLTLTAEQLKAELATREHVPNKVERKLARKKKRGKVRSRS